MEQDMTEHQHVTANADLTELRRSLDVGLTRMDGRFALLLHRGEQAEKDLEDLQTRVSGIERGRWPLPGVAAVTALCALAVSVWQAIGH
jgi:hypothetical protein